MTLANLYEVLIKDSSNIKGFVVDKIIATSYADVVSSYRDSDIILVKYVECIKIV